VLQQWIMCRSCRTRLAACVAGRASAFVARGGAFVAQTLRQSASHGAWLHRKKLCGNHCADEEEASASSHSCATVSMACVASVHGARRVSLRTKMVAAARMALSMAICKEEQTCRNLSFQCRWRRSSACVAGARVEKEGHDVRVEGCCLVRVKSGGCSGSRGTINSVRSQETTCNFCI